MHLAHELGTPHLSVQHLCHEYGEESLPERYRSGAFIGQHGSWNRSTFSGYRVAFVPFSNGRPSGDAEDFLTGFLPDAATAFGREAEVVGLADAAQEPCRPRDPAAHREVGAILRDRGPGRRRIPHAERDHHRLGGEDVHHAQAMHLAVDQEQVDSFVALQVTALDEHRARTERVQTLRRLHGSIFVAHGSLAQPFGLEDVGRDQRGSRQQSIEQHRARVGGEQRDVFLGHAYRIDHERGP